MWFLFLFLFIIIIIIILHLCELLFLCLPFFSWIFVVLLWLGGGGIWFPDSDWNTKFYHDIMAGTALYLSSWISIWKPYLAGENKGLASSFSFYLTVLYALYPSFFLHVSYTLFYYPSYRCLMKNMWPFGVLVEMETASFEVLCFLTLYVLIRELSTFCLEFGLLFYGSFQWWY